MRRVIYFTTVGVSILTAVVPLLARPSGPYECGGPLCFVSAAIATVGKFLPGFLEPWIDFYSGRPFLFLVFVSLILLYLFPDLTFWLPNQFYGR